MDRSEVIKRPKFGSEHRPAQGQATESFPDFTTFREALEAAQLGVWSWDLATNEVNWSSNLAALHGSPLGGFDGSYAGFLNGINEEDRAAVNAALQEAVQKRSAFRARYRVAHTANFDERWIATSGTVFVEDGAARRVIGLCYDVTERANLEIELRSRVKQQEALAQLAEPALAESDLERLLNDAASTIALTLNVDFVKILELLPGDTELLLRTGYGWKSDLAGSLLTTTAPNSFARITLDSAAPVIVDDFDAETRFEVPSYLKDHNCKSGVSVSIAGRVGRAYGILGVCTTKKRRFRPQDISFLAAIGNLLAGAIQRRQLEQRHELMIRDMRHRSGNLFSQLLALFSQTARTSKGIPDLTSKYQARVLAMANAQRLITEGGWKSIPIMELFYIVLGPYIDRVSFEGPNFDLEPDPVFHLSEALHELAVNAIKHGSLSRPKGQLELRWSVSRTQRGMTLTLNWVEKNGPPARRPRKLGFGMRLTDLVIRRQLNGEVAYLYSRKGLSVKLTVPLTHERWPSRGAQAESLITSPALR
ncbi:MAG: HWE histidine kinase domain-containing protein [Xanthobacteraceae bacterium]